MTDIYKYLETKIKETVELYTEEKLLEILRINREKYQDLDTLFHSKNLALNYYPFFMESRGFTVSKTSSKMPIKGRMTYLGKQENIFLIEEFNSKNILTGKTYYIRNNEDCIIILKNGSDEIYRAIRLITSENLVQEAYDFNFYDDNKDAIQFVYNNDLIEKSHSLIQTSGLTIKRESIFHYKNLKLEKISYTQEGSEGFLYEA